MTKRVAIVSGANRGLGRGTAEALAKQGYVVLVCARELAAATQTASELDGECHPARLDVTSDEQVAALFDELDRTYGRVDVLVNNAGAIFDHGGAFTDMPAQTLLRALDTNSVGAYRMIQHALPRMNAAGYGRVVNVSTGMGALEGMGSGWPAYRISKTALSAITLQAHQAAGAGVKVNAVCPGWVRTDMGGGSAPRSVGEGIAGIVWAATLNADGASGGFFRDGQPVPW